MSSGAEAAKMSTLLKNGEKLFSQKGAYDFPADFGNVYLPQKTSFLHTFVLKTHIILAWIIAAKSPVCG